MIQEGGGTVPDSEELLGLLVVDESEEPFDDVVLLRLELELLAVVVVWS